MDKSTVVILKCLRLLLQISGGNEQEANDQRTQLVDEIDQTLKENE